MTEPFKGVVHVTEVHDEMTVDVRDKDGFEEQCMAVLLACGPPPPKPIDVSMQNVDRAALAERNQWIDDVDRLLMLRFKYPMGYSGDFIVAFEAWCHCQAVQEKTEREWKDSFLSHIKEELAK